MEITKAKFSLQSTQVQADADTAARVQTMQRVFAPEDLHEEGIETDPHVTVFYGLDGVSPQQVQAIAGRFQPFDVAFGRTSLFENEEFDVVKVDAESPQLRELHAQLRKLPNQNDREVYQPHLTLAYVKKGMGSKYLIDPLNGRSMRVRYVVFSDEEGRKTVIPFGVTQDDEAETQKNEQCAICGNPSTETLYRATGGKFVSEKSPLAVCQKCGDRIRGLTARPTQSAQSSPLARARELTAVKHGSHDQSTHGHGGGGAGKAQSFITEGSKTYARMSAGSVSEDFIKRYVPIGSTGRHGKQISMGGASGYMIAERVGPNAIKLSKPAGRGVLGTFSPAQLASTWRGSKGITHVDIDATTHDDVWGDSDKSASSPLSYARELTAVKQDPGDPSTPCAMCGRRPAMMRMRNRMGGGQMSVCQKCGDRMNDTTTKETNGLTVFKQADGRYRWVTRSSNAFKDRDSQIVSQKALEDDVVRADTTKDYGPLRFWHMLGVDIGDCDFNSIHNRTLVESGTFRDPAVAEKTASKAADYQISIGFRHPVDQPDEHGVFHTIRRFERSLVPAGRAANPFTSLSVHKEIQHMDNIKIAALKALLDGDEAAVKEILAGAEASEKTADQMGIAFKDHTLNFASADELLEYAIQQKEAELNGTDQSAKEQPKGEATKEGSPAGKEPPEPSEDDEYAMKMSAMVTKMGGYMDRMEKMFGKSEKAADDVTAVNGAVNAHSARLANVETTVKSLTEQLESALKELTELKQDIPTGLGEGKRPTERTDNIVSNGEATKSVAEGFDSFMNFVVETPVN